MTADGEHIVGPLPGIRGLYVAGGCCVGGLTIAPIIGDLLAEWIISGQPRIDLSPLSPSRLAVQTTERGRRSVRTAAGSTPSITGRKSEHGFQPQTDHSRRPDDRLQRDELLRSDHHVDRRSGDHEGVRHLSHADGKCLLGLHPELRDHDDTRRSRRGPAWPPANAPADESVGRAVHGLDGVRGPAGSRFDRGRRACIDRHSARTRRRDRSAVPCLCPDERALDSHCASGRRAGTDYRRSVARAARCPRCCSPGSSGSISGGMSFLIAAVATAGLAVLWFWSVRDHPAGAQVNSPIQRRLQPRGAACSPTAVSCC